MQKKSIVSFFVQFLPDVCKLDNDFVNISGPFNENNRLDITLTVQQKLVNVSLNLNSTVYCV